MYKITKLRKRGEFMPQYVVLQQTLDTKFVGGSLKGVPNIEKAINIQASKGYRLHTLEMVSAEESPSGGIRRTGKVQVIMVFEKV